MNYGMYISATGALSSMHRQDVIANNLANLQTVGFKPDEVYLQARPVERLEDSSFLFARPQFMLEELTGGHFIAPTRTNMTQGELVRTGNDLDLAIRGREGFFVVNSGRGNGATNLRFTRDGRFTQNGNHELVLASNGMRVLDTNDKPIQLTPGASVRIDPDGTVSQDGAAIAQIQIADISDTRNLRKAGDNLFAFVEGAATTRSAAAMRVEQGFVESSAVDPIMTLNAMITATKTVEANTKLIQFHDNMTDQTVNRFARVA